MNRVSKVFQGSVVMAEVLFLFACNLTAVSGNGQVITEDRPAAGFTRLHADTSIQVHVHQASAFSVKVTLDSNLQELVQTVVVGDTLSIHDARPFGSSADPVVEIGMPALSSAGSAGSGDLTVAGFVGDGALALAATGSGSLSFDGACGPLSAEVSGSGSMSLTGQSGHLAATDDGSGSLDASGLLASDGTAVDVSGSGSAKVAVLGNARLSTSGSGSIDANLHAGTASFSVSGSGSITWTGDDQIGEVSTSGSGSVERD